MARTVIRTLIAAVVAAGVFAGCLWLMGLGGYGDDAALWASLATMPWAWAAGTWAAIPPDPSASDLFYAPTSTAEPANLRWRSGHDESGESPMTPPSDGISPEALRRAFAGPDFDLPVKRRWLVVMEGVPHELREPDDRDVGRKEDD